MPREAVKQVSIVLALQAAILTTSFVVKGWEYVSHSFTQVGRLRRSLINAMSREVSSYTEWLRLARQLDSTSKGVNEWILDDRSELYDSHTLRKRILDIESMIAKNDAFNLIFRLRGGLARDQFGLLQERLFSKAFQGTKRLVERYTQTVCSALNFIADEDIFSHNNNQSITCTSGDEDKIPIEAKLAFFNETRHAYGRTALLLSGGAALGYYHIGVAKVLAEEGLLPRVISGASAGSLMAAMIGSRTESELLDLVKTANFRKDFFSFGWQRKSSLTARFQFLLPSFFRTFGDVFLHLVSEKDSILKLDTNHLKEVIIANVGHYTFQEAFDRTGRIVNITVAPLNRYDRPRLLNYLTAPHVCIWSAACASCAIPGVFESIALVVKEPDGQYREQHEWMNQCATTTKEETTEENHTSSSSTTNSTKYSDGSIENDLPMQQLSELFNVNHFIVSQVNPHSFLLSSLSTHSTQGTPGPLRAAAGYLRFAKAQLREWLRNIIDLFMYRRTNSMFGITFRRGFAQILTQEYEGRENDISIMPWKLPAGISMISAFLSLMKNPTEAEFREIVKISERNTVRKKCPPAKFTSFGTLFSSPFPHPHLHPHTFLSLRFPSLRLPSFNCSTLFLSPYRIILFSSPMLHELELTVRLKSASISAFKDCDIASPNPLVNMPNQRKSQTKKVGLHSRLVQW